MYKCEFCGKPITPGSPDTYHKVLAWSPAKGQGAIRLPGPPMGWAHRICVKAMQSELKHGTPGEGDSLF